MNKCKIIELDDTNTCKICENRAGIYTCPRCNILYCSLPCYQSEKHAQCSETFYQDCVMTELKNKDESSRQKMEEILKRVSEQQDDDTNSVDSDDEEESPDLAERLAGIDLDNVKEVWEHLTGDERQEFEALVASGDVTKLVPVWTPWWEFKLQETLVEEVGCENSTRVYVKTCPVIFEDIKPFEEISKVKPAECVKYNLINVIASYTCVVRLFNGDHSDATQEVVYLLTALSKNLEANANFETYSLAMESVYQHALVNDWMATDEDFKRRMYKDIENILQGPEKNNKSFYLKSVLCDIHRLLANAKKKGQKVEAQNEFTKRFMDVELPEDKFVSKDKLKVYVRKTEYYLSYIYSFPCNFQQSVF